MLRAVTRRPSRHAASPRRGEGAIATRDADALTGMVLLPGGEFLMGTDDGVGYPQDGEGPVRRVSLRPFWIDADGSQQRALRGVRRGDRHT